MDKQQQILEMAKDICRAKLNCNDVCNPISACHALKYAARAVEAGYCKQSEGEWLHPLKDKPWKSGTFGRCSVCNDIEDGHIKKMPNFCSNCGSKMKGGDEK